MAVAPAPPAPAAVAAASVGLAPDLKKRVEVMAVHVARAGMDFERTVRERNAGSPQYAFLAGGEGAEYYHALLQAKAASAGGSNALAQVPHSGGNQGQTACTLQEALRRWPEPQGSPALAPEQERRLTEIVVSLQSVASRDAIRTGREWVESQASMSGAVAAALAKRVHGLGTCSHRLHLLFLVHDLLMQEASSGVLFRPVALSFKPYLPWMLRPAYMHSLQVAGESQKVLKLLSLWPERGILTAAEAADMRAIVTAADPLPVPVPAAGGGCVSSGGGAGLLQQVQAQMQAQQAAAAAGAPCPMPLPRGAGTPSPQMMAPRPYPCPQPTPSAVAARANAKPQLQAGSAALQTLAAGRGAQTPETVPVGVMSSMLKQVSRRGKDLHTAFLPYRPLDPLYTPQVPPSNSPVTQRLMDRLADFYEVTRDWVKDQPALASARCTGQQDAAPAALGARAAVPLVVAFPPVANRAAARQRSRSRSPQSDERGNASAMGFAAVVPVPGRTAFCGPPSTPHPAVEHAD